MMGAPAQPLHQLRQAPVRRPEVRSRDLRQATGDRVGLPNGAPVFDQDRHQGVRIDHAEGLLMVRMPRTGEDILDRTLEMPCDRDSDARIEVRGVVEFHRFTLQGSVDGPRADGPAAGELALRSNGGRPDRQIRRSFFDPPDSTWYLESQIGIAAHPSRRPRSLSQGIKSLRKPKVTSGPAGSADWSGGSSPFQRHGRRYCGRPRTANR